ncbi:MAG: ATP-binding cassette domain-containing protein [Rikenellaceae bacterium]
MNLKYSIEIKAGLTRQPQFRMAAEVNLAIAHKEQVAIVGDNASGKSALVGMITGEYPVVNSSSVAYDFGDSPSARVSDNIKYIAFRDSYGAADGAYYYQQRWNSQDRDEAPLVVDSLPAIDDSPLKESLFRLFRIEEMLHKQIILLSSGELRKFQITKVLLTAPRIVVMDNPFIGLDAPTRDQLHALLGELTATLDLQIILVFSKSDDIPRFVTHIIPVEGMVCGAKITRQEYLDSCLPVATPQLSASRRAMIEQLPITLSTATSDEVIEMRRVSIRYGSRTILNNLDWRVMQGERWALSGENGAGKSTLLSLVCADNPQSYACDMSLFGRKRGSGESIWDIKRRIGYVSPEMHRAYRTALPAIDVVSSGHHDTTELYECRNKSELEKSIYWMEIFGIAHLRDRRFMQCSSGEQRLILLARAFVKDPDLLVLDEPFHGLDLKNREMVREIISAFCMRANKTLIIVSHYPEDLPREITNSLHLRRV